MASYAEVTSKPHHAEWKVTISGVDHTDIVSMEITRGMMGDTPKVGSCIAGTLKLTILDPNEQIPRMAEIKPFVRLSNDDEATEWYPQGVFYVDTRKRINDGKIATMAFEAFDAMLKTEQDCPASGTDITVVNSIASMIGVTVDASVTNAITNGYSVASTYKNNNTAREVLGFIAAAYGGAFFIGNDGSLKFATMYLPVDTNFLVNEDGDEIMFGEDLLIV